MSLASSDGLETAWESVWRVRGGVGGRGKGKKRLEDPGIDPGTSRIHASVYM